MSSGVKKLKIWFNGFWLSHINHLPSILKVSVCACVCVRDRHTSVFAINLTLDSSFEHKPAHVHMHTLSASKSELSSCQRPLSSPLPPRLSVKNCFPLSPLSSLPCRPPSSFQSSLFSFCYSLSTCAPSIDIPVYAIKVLKLLLLTNARYCKRSHFCLLQS